MYEFMKKVKEKETVKNILVDLSMNGGGSVYAMIRALGFMTNKQILNREYNELNKIASITKANVDTQKSDEFKPHDYDQKYKW
ncbi:Periplasmic protease, partial [Metamycoplasma alkalescens]